MSTEFGKPAQKGPPKPVTDSLDLGDARVVIIASRFNDFVVDRLVAGASSRLRELGIVLDETDFLRVPGAFELPLAARAIAESGSHDGVVALGAVIRGETAHFEYVCAQCASGLMQVSIDYGIPIGFGVLTVDTETQALARASDNDNKGIEAAQAVAEMIALLRRIPQ